MRTDGTYDTTTFRQTWFRTGYATDEVDPFVAAVQEALGSHRSGLGATDLAYQRFTPVLLKRGYRMQEVDDYVTEAKHLLEEREERAW